MSGGGFASSFDKLRMRRKVGGEGDAGRGGDGGRFDCVFTPAISPTLTISLILSLSKDEADAGRPRHV